MTRHQVTLGLASFTIDQPFPPDIIISNLSAQKSELHGDEEIRPIVREKDGKKASLQPSYQQCSDLIEEEWHRDKLR